MLVGLTDKSTKDEENRTSVDLRKFLVWTISLRIWAEGGAFLSLNSSEVALLSEMSSSEAFLNICKS